MKLLMLKGMASYASPVTRGTVVRRGEVIKVSDASAEKLEGLVRYQNDGQEGSEDIEVKYFIAQPEGTAVTHDFSNREDEAKGAPATEPAKFDVEEAEGEDTTGEGGEGQEANSQATPPAAAKPAAKKPVVTHATPKPATTVQRRKR